MTQSLQEIQKPLLQWYAAHARALPWRENTDPYRVWVSEIMLQQTRVDTVIGYFNRFMQALPDVQALSRCPQDTLYKLWEGLGYYSRVRNLQKAAQIVADQYGGHLPENYEALLKLPGIGAYTAGAIASIAFEQKHAAVDGNVLRILARITADPGDLNNPDLRRRYGQMLEAIYPARGQRGAFTQSLMELGATVCLPNGRPLCENCPVSAYCQAFLEDMTESFPVKTPKRAKQEQAITVFLICCAGKIALMRRPEKGLLSGMWSFVHTQEALDAQSATRWLDRHGVHADQITPLPTRRHIFTHVIWHMNGFAVAAPQIPDAFMAADEAALARCALPTAFAKYLPEALLALRS